jgi:hypothetical protein
LVGAIGPDSEVVVEDDRLAVQQERRGCGRRRVDEFVDERDESLPEPLSRLVPLAIPVRV